MSPDASLSLILSILGLIISAFYRILWLATPSSSARILEILVEDLA